MSTRRVISVAVLALLTLGVVYLTFIEWLVAGIGVAMDYGEQTGPLDGYERFAAGLVVTSALLAVTVLVAVRGRRRTQRDLRDEMTDA